MVNPIRLRWFFILLGSTLFYTSLQAETESSADAAYGTFHISSRFRYENVDDDRLSPAAQRLKDANASTLRTSLGYQSPETYGFDLRVDLEHVMSLDNNNFNDGSNGLTDLATVVDPSGLELDQAFLRYQHKSNTEIKLGRQYLTYRDAPLHRFMGTVLWRQNWQTQDAIAITNKTLDDMTISYAYVWNVNRIFGHDAPEPLSNFDSNSHLVNLQYSGLAAGKLEAYAYLLDLNNAAAFSTQTYGLRFDGKYRVSDTLSALYVGEYAHQSDYADNPASISTDYFLAELGANIKVNKTIDNLTLKIAYEKMAGEGGANRFVTILGTNHAFQGWADRFLVTPGDGIEDLIVTALVKLWGATFVAAYHQLGSDNMSYDYGNELDLMLSKKYGKHYTFGLKYSVYDADRNPLNVIRNGSNSGVANNVNKVWVWAQLNF
ncbi:MAG: hypothetical protein ACI909_004248 [Planctomycetota bacterium]|jgi:hypothetical protein